MSWCKRCDATWSGNEDALRDMRQDEHERQQQAATRQYIDVDAEDVEGAQQREAATGSGNEDALRDMRQDEHECQQHAATRQHIDVDAEDVEGAQQREAATWSGNEDALRDMRQTFDSQQHQEPAWSGSENALCSARNANPAIVIGYNDEESDETGKLAVQKYEVVDEEDDTRDAWPQVAGTSMSENDTSHRCARGTPAGNIAWGGASMNGDVRVVGPGLACWLHTAIVILRTAHVGFAIPEWAQGFGDPVDFVLAAGERVFPLAARTTTAEETHFVMHCRAVKGEDRAEQILRTAASFVDFEIAAAGVYVAGRQHFYAVSRDPTRGSASSVVTDTLLTSGWKNNQRSLLSSLTALRDGHEIDLVLMTRRTVKSPGHGKGTNQTGSRSPLKATPKKASTAVVPKSSTGMEKMKAKESIAPASTTAARPVPKPPLPIETPECAPSYFNPGAARVVTRQVRSILLDTAISLVARMGPVPALLSLAGHVSVRRPEGVSRSAHFAAALKRARDEPREAGPDQPTKPKGLDTHGTCHATRVSNASRNLQPMVDAAVAAFKQGHKGRAVELLMRALKPVDRFTDMEAVHQELMRLHPAEPARARVSTPEGVVVVTADEVFTAVKRGAKGEAPAFSGLCSDLLAQLILFEREAAGDQMLTTITSIVQSVLDGTISDADKKNLLTVRMVAIPKPKTAKNGTRVRPLALSETLTKVCARVALGRMPGFGSEFAGQYGLRKGGCEAVIHRVRAALRSGKRVVCLDGTNAYNTIYRSVIAKALAGVDTADALALKTYFNAVYGVTSAAFVKLPNVEDANGGVRYRFGRVEVSRGVRQGDPAAPLFFCLGIQQALLDTERRHGVEVLAYLDDITIIGDDAVAEATTFLVAEMLKLGITYNVEQDSSDPKRRLGLRLLGAAICKNEIDTNALLEDIRPMHDYSLFAQAVERLPDVFRLEALRMCGVAKATFVARTHGAEATGWLSKFDDISDHIVAGALGVRPEVARSSAKVALPVDMGGLGITRFAKVAGMMHDASVAGADQKKVLEAHYSKTAIPAAAETNVHQIQVDVTGPEAAFVSPRDLQALLRHRVDVPFVSGPMAQGMVVCPGCGVEMTGGRLVHHAPVCARWAGAGNPTVRHDQAKCALARELRARGTLVEVESAVGPPGGGLRMDLVVGGRNWFDLTVTQDQRARFAAKELRYGELAKTEKAKLAVLAFDVNGNIHGASYKAARKMAREVNSSVPELFGRAALAVAVGSVRARMRAAAHVAALWHNGTTSRPVSVAKPTASVTQLTDGRVDDAKTSVPKNFVSNVLLADVRDPASVPANVPSESAKSVMPKVDVNLTSLSTKCVTGQADESTK